MKPYSEVMTFDMFQQTTQEMMAEIPEEFTQGLQGLHIFQKTKAERDLPDVYRLGEYLDPGPDQFLGGNQGLGRHIALYYGSFLTIAKGDSDLDWEEQLWETLTHELQHHVESLAGDRTLIDIDHRRNAEFRKRPGY
jgi:hypothetical protein